MAKVLESVDQRTQLVGENRLELLLFRINSMQLFAINVFKVREVVKLPPLNTLPGSHAHVAGVANIRGVSIPVIDLRAAIGFKPIETTAESNLIITEYNRTIQGFLVGKVEHIVNMTWSDILPPPKTAGANNYLTAITRLEENDRSQLVSIIDVEKVLAEIIDYDTNLSAGILDDGLVNHLKGQHILVVDDSGTARRQVKETLCPLGIDITEVQDGLQALELLQSWTRDGVNVNQKLLMVITDAEMPEMDGYKLTAEIRSDEKLKDLYVVLNTSLSGNFNNAMAEKVGCNKFISKFQPDMLVSLVQERLREKLKAYSKC